MKIIAAVLVFLCLLTPVNAIEPLILNVEGISHNEQVLHIYCNTNISELPDIGDFIVTLGNTQLPIAGISDLENTPISLIFLVDVSGSMSREQFTAVKATLSAISQKLSDDDNVSLVTVGNEADAKPFISGADNIQAYIDELERSAEDTNLYESLVKALAILSTNESCHAKKALIIFSDGEEDYLRGITYEEAAMKIEAGRIPIYTVAALGWNPAPHHTESAKVLGSFARLSPGGLHYLHSLDANASEEIAEGIVTSIRGGLIVSAELSVFSSDGNEMLLWVELNSPGVGTAGDGYSIPTAGLSNTITGDPSPTQDIAQDATHDLTPDITLDVIQDVTSDVTSASDPSLSPGRKFFYPVIIAPIIVLVFIYFIKRRNGVYHEHQSTDIMPPRGHPKIALCLTKIGPVEEQIYHAEFAGTLIIGRDHSTTNLTFKSDSLISARHCAIGYEPDGIVLRDLGSTEGTFVNGVPIESRYLLEKDDIISIGSIELRVTWDVM